MADFPDSEGDLNTYFQTGSTYITTNKVRFLVSADNETDLTTDMGLWNLRYPLATNPATSTTTAVKDKNDTKVDLKNVFRKIIGDIPISVLTNADRATLNIPVVGGAHGKVPLPDSEPVGKLDTSKRLQHTIHFVDSVTGKKAQPHGVSGCEIWQKIDGTQPVNASELTYVGSTADDKFNCNFDGTSAGKMVYYWPRWVNSRNDKGSWGGMFSGNVQG